MAEKFEITLEQLKYLAEYARCGLATNGRDYGKLNEIFHDVQSKAVESPVFRPVSDWNEDDSIALFFKAGSDEPAEVTSPEATCFDSTYHTHFMAMPKELKFTKDFKETCERSGINLSEYNS